MKQVLGHPVFAPFCFAMMSALALCAAFIAEYFFGLAPCNLCVIQRWPFAIIIMLGLIGIVVGGGRRPGLAAFPMALIAVSFLANSVVAFYHSGVERKWWVSFLEACNVPDFSGDITDVMARIEAAPVVRCDEIPWADPVLGLSMANYNVAFCFGLFVAAIMSIMWIRNSRQSA